MTEQPGGLAADGTASLEVRWIVAGRLASAMSEWFGRFPAAMESREDSYLLDPQLHGLAVKVRAAGALDVKVYGGSPGTLEVANRARGRIEAWRKWSFPCGPIGHQRSDPAGWMPIRKSRRISQFSLASGTARPQLPGPGEEPGCAVELTEFLAAGQAWWSLGFEATGPARLLRDELEAAAALVFAQALPGGLELGAADSRSYVEWLRGQPGVSTGDLPDEGSARGSQRARHATSIPSIICTAISLPGSLTPPAGPCPVFRDAP